MTENKSAEDYLETILILNGKLSSVRSIDIVNETGYSKPSISIAMKKLREKSLITMDKFGMIELTKEGLDLAESVYKKHCCLRDFFLAIGVDEKTAQEDACKIEHEISEKTFECIKTISEKITHNQP